MTSFVSTTQLQRESKKILNSDNVFQIVLNNNEFSGIVIPKNSAEQMMESGVFEQIQEELEEMQDKTTCEVIEQGRKNPEGEISFGDFRDKYGI